MVKSLLRIDYMADYFEKLNKICIELNNSEIDGQVKEINNIVKHVKNSLPLEEAPKKLGFLPDQFEEVSKSVGDEKRATLMTMNHLLNSVRQYLSLKFGVWSLPNLKTANLIKNRLHVNTALEIMSGNAYWSRALDSVGIKTVATDSLEWAKTSSTGRTYFFPVEDIDAVNAIKKYRHVDLIICSWSPNFGKSDIEVVKAWKKYSSNSKLLFIGEKDGATNSEDFWNNTIFVHSKEMNEINQSFQSYDFIDEKVYQVDKI